MKTRRWKLFLGLSMVIGLGACAQPTGLPTPQTNKVPDEAQLQAQLPENPQESDLVSLPSALLQGDTVNGFSTQQVRSLSQNYRYLRRGNRFFAYWRYGSRYEPVLTYRYGRPYRVVYFYTAPYYYYRMVPFYGQYTFPGRTRAVVTIQNYSYIPRVIRVRQNARVTWINYDSVPHTSTGPLPGQVTIEGPWDIDLQPGQSGSKQFLYPGRQEYYCRYHPYMRGAVMVDSGGVTP